MYNEEIKKRYIQTTTRSKDTMKMYEFLFRATEPFEQEKDSDICTMSTEEAQIIVDKFSALRKYSMEKYVQLLSSYSKWCINNGVPNATNNIKNVRVSGLEAVRKGMVFSPYHLQLYLDSVFDDESLETYDNCLRCCYWLSFAGCFEEDIFKIKASDVDFNKMTISVGKEGGYMIVKIPPEGLQAIRNCATLTQFRYQHSNYKEDIFRNRVAGDQLIRGVKEEALPTTVLTNISRKVSKAIKAGKTDSKIFLSRVWLSGHFYRKHSQEVSGMDYDFEDMAMAYLLKKKDECNEWPPPHKRIEKVAEKYEDDYLRWKLAFLK